MSHYNARVWKSMQLEEYKTLECQIFHHNHQNRKWWGISRLGTTEEVQQAIE